MTWKPLIEQWFPAQTIGAESLRERGSPKAYPPINMLHVWWARRPLTASRAAILASILPAWPSEEEATTDGDVRRIHELLVKEFGTQTVYQSWFLTTLGIMGDPVGGRAALAEANAKGLKLKGNGYGYPRAFTITPDNAAVAQISRLAAARTGEVFHQPSVLDPFAGGGSIPFEAARLGARAIANELNPVAAAVLHGTVRYPAVLGPAFGGVLRRWGSVWADRIRQHLSPYFPVEEGEKVIAYIWAHTVPCPTTGRPTPLVPEFWLARGKANRDIAVRLDVDTHRGTVELSIVEGDAAKEWGDWSTYKRGTATSIWTGETFSTDYIRSNARAGRVGDMLLAVSVIRQGVSGRQFRAPTDDDQAAIVKAQRAVDANLAGWEINDLVPTEEIPEGHKTDEPRNMGLLTWRQMFSARQLLTHATALDELRRVVQEASAQLSSEQTKALNLYLAFAFDKAIDYDGMLSSWHSSRMMVRNVFDRHDFSFKWTYAEFDGARSLFPWAIENIAVDIEKIARLASTPNRLGDAERVVQAEVMLGSAVSLPLDDHSVDAIITDPPYYDNVQYAECSDYFYVWQKRSLVASFPELGRLDLTDKQAEAVANPSLFTDVATAVGRGRNRTGKSATDLADEHYERLLTQSFREAHRVLKDDGVLTVMFTHKRVDAWDTLGQALLEGGFAIGSSWPVHTESEHSLHQAKKNAANSTIFLACTKRISSEPAYWDQVRTKVQDKARWAVQEFSKPEFGLKGIDLTLATFGPVLSVLSDHWPVYTGHLDGNGDPVPIRPEAALAIAREEVAKAKKRGLLGGRDAEFDPLTDWWLMAWNDFQAAQFPAGEALKLSLAMHLDLDDLIKKHRVAASKSGNVEILSPAQRRTAKAIDQEAVSYGSLVDALHVLMLTYEEEGKVAAESWLQRTGYRDSPRFEDLLVMALKAVPRTRDAKGTWARPEAKTLEGLRATIFDHIPDPDVEAAKVREIEDAARRAVVMMRGKQLRLDGVAEDQLGFDDLSDEDDDEDDDADEDE